MNILLTSSGMRIKDEILRVLPKPASELRLVHIPTASLVEQDQAYMHRDREALPAAGFHVTEFDIAGKSQDEVRDALKDADVIYVQGGNTFHLLKCIRASGADVVFQEAIERGALYIGVSAGSIVTGPSIEIASWDLPSISGDANFDNMTDFTGMSLVPFVVAVHAHPEDIPALRERKLTYPIRVLTDVQALLITDNGVTFLGEGEELIV